MTTESIELAEKILKELIMEAQRMNQTIKTEEKQIAYKNFKTEQLNNLAEIIEEMKMDIPDTVYLQIPSEPQTQFVNKFEHYEDMSILKIHGLHGKEAARMESLRRQAEFMEYQVEKYGCKSKQ